MRSMWKIEVGKYFRVMTLAHRLSHCPLGATPNFVESYGVSFSVADPGFPRGIPERDVNILCGQRFAESCMKMKSNQGVSLCIQH